MLSREVPAIVKWKNTENAPDVDAPVVWITKKWKIGTFKTVAGKWEWLVKKYNIILWTYQDSIIPEALDRESRTIKE